MLLPRLLLFLIPICCIAAYQQERLNADKQQQYDIVEQISNKNAPWVTNLLEIILLEKKLKLGDIQTRMENSVEILGDLYHQYPCNDDKNENCQNDRRTYQQIIEGVIRETLSNFNTLSRLCTTRPIPTLEAVKANIVHKRHPFDFHSNFYLQQELPTSRRNRRFVFSTTAVLIPALISLVSSSIVVGASEMSKHELRTQTQHQFAQIDEKMAELQKLNDEDIANIRASIGAIAQQKANSNNVRLFSMDMKHIGNLLIENLEVNSHLSPRNPLTADVIQAIQEKFATRTDLSVEERNIVKRQTLSLVSEFVQIQTIDGASMDCNNVEMNLLFMAPVPDVHAKMVLVPVPGVPNFFKSTREDRRNWIYSSNPNSIRTTSMNNGGGRPLRVEGRICGALSPTVRVIYGENSTWYFDSLIIITAIPFIVTHRCYDDDKLPQKFTVRNNTHIGLHMSCSIQSSELFCPLIKNKLENNNVEVVFSTISYNHHQNENDMIDEWQENKKHKIKVLNDKYSSSTSGYLIKNWFAGNPLAVGLSIAVFLLVICVASILCCCWRRLICCSSCFQKPTNLETSERDYQPLKAAAAADVERSKTDNNKCKKPPHKAVAAAAAHDDVERSKSENNQSKKPPHKALAAADDDVEKGKVRSYARCRTRSQTNFVNFADDAPAEN